MAKVPELAGLPCVRMCMPWRSLPLAKMPSAPLLRGRLARCRGWRGCRVSEWRGRLMVALCDCGRLPMLKCKIIKEKAMESKEKMCK